MSRRQDDGPRAIQQPVAVDGAAASPLNGALGGDEAPAADRHSSGGSMAKISAEWHKANRMPRNATLEPSARHHGPPCAADARGRC